MLKNFFARLFFADSRKLFGRLGPYGDGDLTVTVLTALHALVTVLTVLYALVTVLTALYVPVTVLTCR